MKIRLIPIIVFIVLPFGIKAQDTYDLKRCLAIGLQQNYDIRIEKNDQEIADNNVTIGNAGYLPQLDLSAGYSGTVDNTEQRLKSTGETAKNNGTHNQRLNAGMNLNWTVFDGFSIQTNHSRLKELQQMGELNTRITIEDFISNLTTEYYNYVQQNIRLKNLKYAVKLSKERLRIVEAQYNIGSMSRLDLQQAKVDFNADSSKLIKQNEILYTSRIKLNQLMAVDDVEQGLITADSLINYDPLLSKDDIWQLTLVNNGYLLLSQKEKVLSQLDLKTAQSTNYPYLRLNTGYGYTENMYETGSYDRQRNLGLNYGITLGFNLFDGFNKKRKQRNARIAIDTKELQLQQLQLSLKSDLSNIWMAYRNNIELTNLEKENLATAVDNYEIAMERYKLKELAGIELREAQNSLFEAEERLVQAEYNTKLCEISLIQISGQITDYLD